MAVYHPADCYQGSGDTIEINAPNRNMVFVSHASTEDNLFAQ